MKPKLAFFDFTGCEGCQLEVINFETELVELLEHVDIVNFREAISTESDIERIKRIREQAKVLITIGACSSLGGVNCLKNSRPMEENLRIVYGDAAKYYDTIPARPVSAVVPVDYELSQCPVNRHEFIKLTKALLLGKRFKLPNYPVCVECKMAGNVCVFEKGGFCLGPVTRAGCNAICVTTGRHCWGCRGLVDDPNVDSEKELLQKHGLSVNDILSQFRLFNAHFVESV
jgi:sulfhydrogenase subunit delta